MASESYSVSAYCLSCKSPVTYEAEIKKSATGRRTAEGKCPNCKTKLSRVLGRAQ